MSVRDWVWGWNTVLEVWLEQRPEGFAGAERIVVAGNAGGVVATLSLIGTIIGPGGQPEALARTMIRELALEEQQRSGGG